MARTDTLERVTTGTTDDTACCSHFVRDGLTATFPDGCSVEWDDEGFIFIHAHPDREAEVTFEEPD